MDSVVQSPGVRIENAFQWKVNRGSAIRSVGPVGGDF
jgi:hypothetical protein